MTERESLISLASFVPFGSARITLLLKYFGTAKSAWKASEKDLLTIGLSEKLSQNFIIHRNSFNQTDYFNKIKRLNLEIITFLDNKYPANLKDLLGAPVLIYVKGRLIAQDKNAVAIVGSRKMTSYGKEVAEQFSSELASNGVTIISGLARGIDTISHKAALSVGGRTIAVVGCGLDTLYPPENISLAEEIAQSGAVISEYPLGYPAYPLNFAARNRIISGLSKSVLIVEGRRKSGTLLTASHAAEQGRDVYAVPGQITSPNSEAPHFLLSNGAKIAFSPADILNDIGINAKVDNDFASLPNTKDEDYLLGFLDSEPLHLDELVRITSIDTGSISARLTVMEMKGLVKNLGSGVYKKN
jgi:DNA processing protein